MEKHLLLIAAAAMTMFYGCSLDESGFKPVQSQDAAPKVQIYGEIHQQPATKVAIDDGFCAGDEVGVYLVN